MSWQRLTNRARFKFTLEDSNFKQAKKTTKINK